MKYFCLKSAIIMH